MKQKFGIIGLIAVGLLIVFFPTLMDTAHQWMINDNYSHGFLVFPCVAYMLWARRDRFREARIDPNPVGFVLLAGGLLMQSISYILQIKYVGMWALVPTLAGLTLVVWGNEYWKIARYAILFIFFAAPISNTLLAQITQSLQYICTVASYNVMSFFGFDLLRHGNVIAVPGAELDVAAACSGFHKMVSLLAFASVYGYLSTESPSQRFMLMLVSVPIALASNIFRISLLVAVTSSGGMTAFHKWHDPAEYIAILLAFAMLVGFGKIIGCEKTPNSQLVPA